MDVTTARHITAHRLIHHARYTEAWAVRHLRAAFRDALADYPHHDADAWDTYEVAGRYLTDARDTRATAYDLIEEHP